jgi:hypothetical protein
MTTFYLMERLRQIHQVRSKLRGIRPHFGLKILESVHIIEYRGATKENLTNALLIVLADPRFPELKHIGIVRDADFKGGAFASVVGAIESANQEFQDAENAYQLPIPKKAFEGYGANLQLSVLIVPHEEKVGMLETVIIEALRDAGENGVNIMPCVDAYFACLEQAGINAKPQAEPKAIMNVYMAALSLYQAQMRAYIEARKVDESATNKDRKRGYLSDIYGMSWWSWDKDAFARIKDYLIQLTTTDSE